MIRTYYVLPEERLGCNAIALRHAIIRPNGLEIEGDAGTAEVEGGEVVQLAPGVEALMGASVVLGTFERAPEISMRPRHVEYTSHFLDWIANEYQANPADNQVQQLVSGALEYLWLQEKGLLNLPEDPE